MKKVLIQRTETDDAGTFGGLICDSKGVFECYTAELPWRSNAPGLSRIPAGVYKVVWGQSPSRKNPDGSPEWTFRIQDVPSREGVLIHSGNFAGDKEHGLATDVEGCILLGRAIMDIEITPEKARHQPWISPGLVKQKGVSSSRDTVAAFVAFMGKDPFELTILDEKTEA